ncbi:MAG: thiamine diphosphokinase [Dehalococcoidales bacterium]|nr:thiamine diphosphokinase [Dehalococcoidales bacterium]
MKALVLVNGELYRPAILRNRVHENAFDLVIGVDGGSGHALPLNVGLDAIIGDMDSLTDLDKKDINNIELVSYPPEKDETDLELALLYAKKRGADEIIMVGALGGRMEMTIANILMMTDAALGPCKVKVWHGEQTGWVIKPPGEPIMGNPGDTVSLIPLSGSASGITTEGLKYPLKNAELTIGLTRGISNLLEESPAHIKLSRGLLLVVHTPGRA